MVVPYHFNHYINIRVVDDEKGVIDQFHIVTLHQTGGARQVAHRHHRNLDRSAGSVRNQLRVASQHRVGSHAHRAKAQHAHAQRCNCMQRCNRVHGHSIGMAIDSKAGLVILVHKTLSDEQLLTQLPVLGLFYRGERHQ